MLTKPLTSLVLMNVCTAQTPQHVRSVKIHTIIYVKNSLKKIVKQHKHGELLL